VLLPAPIELLPQSRVHHAAPGANFGLDALQGDIRVRKPLLGPCNGFRGAVSEASH
jgi:hypothetical protein